MRWNWRPYAENYGELVQAYLSAGYEQAFGIPNQVIVGYPAGVVDSGLIYFPDFVEVFGLDERHWDLSMAVLERYTPFSTAEFAVRPLS